MEQLDEKTIRELAEHAVKIAGVFIRLMALDKLAIFKTEKLADTDGFLSIFDREAARLIVNTIKIRFPNTPIYTDANTNTKDGIDNITSLTWFVDPLDGTKAFFNGQFAFVSLCIAAMDENGLIAAAIYNPFTDMLYSASKKSECFLNLEKIPKPVQKTRKNARILIDFSNTIEDNIKYALATADLRNEIGRVLRFDGSIAQHLALIAQGTLDGAIIWGTGGSKGAYWDLAAAILLLDRQGIKITDFEGKEILPTSNSFDQLVIAEPSLHKELMEYVQRLKQYQLQTFESSQRRKKYWSLFKN